MWLKTNLYRWLFMAFLLFFYNVMPTSATNMAQSKNPQQAPDHTTTSTSQHQHQLHTNHVSSHTQHQLQQKTLQSVEIAAHPDNSIPYDSNAGHHIAKASLSSSPTSSIANLPSSQYGVHDKEKAMQDILKQFNGDTALNDPYQIFNEFKRESHENSNQGQPPAPPIVAVQPNGMVYPWNFYDRSYASISLPHSPMAGLFSQNFNPFDIFPTPFPVTPSFLPIMSYTQPVYVPYPFIMSPDMFLASLPQMTNDYEDSMSRGAGTSRHPASNRHSSNLPRNSPIFYMRLPPTPYMFLPNLGLGSNSYPNMLPYNTLSPFHSFSSIFNVPINFLANGKPSNIYQMSAPPNEVQHTFPFSNIPSSLSTRPPPPPPPNAYRPAASSHKYFSPQHTFPSPASNYASYAPTATLPLASSSSLPHHDSKLISLKRPYFLNGHPEDIYILPNNFNNLFSSENGYY